MLRVGEEYVPGASDICVDLLSVRKVGFILDQLVLASVSVSDLKGTHLHRQSVYQLW